MHQALKAQGQLAVQCYSLKHMGMNGQLCAKATLLSRQ